MSAENENPRSEPSGRWSGGGLLRGILLLAVVAAAGMIYWQFGGVLSLDYLASRETELREYGSHHPLLVYGAAMAIYIVATGLSLPGATVLTLTYAWYFGFVRGLVLVSFASTAGATMAFLMSRYFLRQTIQSRFGAKLTSFNEALDRDGPFYLFTLRLIPAVPFFVINVVMGLTSLGTFTFWWVSQLGMLPGTAVYVYAGSQFPDLKTLADQGASGILSPQLVAAFVLLGLFPVVVKKTIGRWKAGRAAKNAGS